MRRFLTLSLSLLLLLFPFAGSAFAAEKASAEIPVIIDGGGTATIIPEVNSPLPTENPIHVDNGRTGYFYIYFDEPGVYHYTITAEFSENVKIMKTDEAYRLTVQVYEREDGMLYTATTINSSRSSEKKSQVRFNRGAESTTQPPETTTTESPSETSTTESPSETSTTESPSETSTTPSLPPETTTTTSTPRTGDESNLTRYVLLATASAAGLFLLALLYTINTNKLIREE